eukprot:8222403-Pyramimonas_sp.AAC.1
MNCVVRIPPRPRARFRHAPALQTLPGAAVGDRRSAPYGQGAPASGAGGLVFPGRRRGGGEYRERSEVLLQRGAPGVREGAIREAVRGGEGEGIRESGR